MSNTGTSRPDPVEEGRVKEESSTNSASGDREGIGRDLEGFRFRCHSSSHWCASCWYFLGNSPVYRRKEGTG